MHLLKKLKKTIKDFNILRKLFPKHYDMFELYTSPEEFTYKERFLLVYYSLLYKYFRIRSKGKNVQMAMFLDIFIYGHYYLDPVKLVKSQFDDNSQEVTKYEHNR